MKKNILNNNFIKILSFSLLTLVILVILYCFMSNNYKSNDISPVDTLPLKSYSNNIIEGFNNSNIGYNPNKMIIIYTATWCPHCRSFMGMKDKDSPISEDSEFAKTKRELGNCFEHVKDTDPNSSERMQKHGINGYPGIAFVDKNTDVGVPLGNVRRTSEDICAKFKALSS